MSFLIEWENSSLIYGGLTLFSIKKDLVGGSIRKDGNNFARPVGIVLTFGKNHVIESKAADHNKGRQIVCNS